jgi:hypothetical protein
VNKQDDRKDLKDFAFDLTGWLRKMYEGHPGTDVRVEIIKALESIAKAAINTGVIELESAGRIRALEKALEEKLSRDIDADDIEAAILYHTDLNEVDKGSLLELIEKLQDGNWEVAVKWRERVALSPKGDAS